MKRCPYCAEEVQDEAILCKHCRRELPSSSLPASAEPGYDFAAIDLETTGFDAARSDRIIEVAVARFSPSGDLLSTYSTLVNPKRDVGPTRIHGITASDVIDAPTFDQVAGDLADHLAGAIICGHNVSFDSRFLDAEYARMGNPPPPGPSLCTLRLAGKLKLTLPNRKLETCCKHYGIDTGTSHTAESDAKAAGLLLFCLLALAEERGLNDLRSLGAAPLPPPGREQWPIHALGTASKLRTFGAVSKSHSYLGDLVSRLPLEADTDPDLLPYLELLDRILEDRLVTEEEARSLEFIAAASDMTREQAHVAHATYFNQLVGVALADGVVSQSESADLDNVAALLGIPHGESDAALALATHDYQPTHARTADLRGQVVCFTGQLGSSIGGEPITREQAASIAERAGLVVSPTLTKKVNFLVVADPNTQSSKARKARGHGTRILAEEVFWSMIGQETD